MSESEKVVMEILDRANQHDVPAMMEFVAEDFRFLNPMTGPTDKRGAADFHSGMFTAFPDIRYNIDRIFSSDDWVAVQCTVEGTHQAEIAGIPATGKRITVPVGFMAQVTEGKAQDWTAYFDVATMLRQLGVMQ
jgi:steroid delta-isomerase-like uncharacterized protein